MTSFPLNYLFKGPMSKYSHIRDWRDTIQFITLGNKGLHDYEVINAIH